MSKYIEYAWQLYTDTEIGRKNIRTFEGLDLKQYQEDAGENDFMPPYLIEPELSDAQFNFFKSNYLNYRFSECFSDFCQRHKVDTIDDATKLFRNIITKGVPVIVKDKKGKEKKLGRVLGQGLEFQIFELLFDITHLLFSIYPNYFFPYRYAPSFYTGGEQFDSLTAVFKELSIPLPKIPTKRDALGKALYYAEINKVVYEYRKEHGLSPAEICAQIYAFGIDIINLNLDDEMPKPSKAWILKGGAGIDDFEFIDNATSDSVSYWQGNLDIRRGDILLMYCLTPRSHINSIWRAHCDGFVEPFFHYHQTVRVCSPIYTKTVSLNEMRKDPVLSQKGLIKGNMQGASGNSLTVEEYNAILAIMKKKKQDISILPKLEPPPFPENLELDNEKDIEEKLVEKFFRDLGYTEKNWIRQMPLRMGRGERIYPDYAFGAVAKAGEESAPMVLEAKFEIATKRQLRDAFIQARSYAHVLQSRIIVLAAKEGLWVFKRKKNDFSVGDYVYYTWKDLKSTDIVHELRKSIGKKAILGGRRGL